MDSVLDFMFLRRLKVEYVSPPVCPFPVGSGSSEAVGQFIPPLVQIPPMVANAGFLTWGEQPNQICYNIYEETTPDNFVNIASCVSPNTLIVCSAACWRVSAVVGNVEGPLSTPVCTDGTTLTEIPLPFATGITSYRVYKSTDSGVTYNIVLAGIFTGAFEVCDFVCYAISAITPDGETPLSQKVCPSGSPFSDKTLDWANRVVRNGYTRPTDATLAIVDAWHLQNVANGVDLKYVWCAVPCIDGLGTLVTPYYITKGYDPAIITNQQGPVSSLFVAGGCELTGGSETGNTGAAIIIDTGVKPATDLATSAAGICVYGVYDSGTTGASQYWGGSTDAGFASSFVLVVPPVPTSLFIEAFGIGAGNFTSAPGGLGINGWVSGQRTSPNLISLYNGRSSTGHVTLATDATAQTGTPASNTFGVVFGSYSVAGVTQGYQCLAICGLLAITSGFTAAEDALAYAATQTMMTSRGAAL